jgi:amino acid transporter
LAVLLLIATSRVAYSMARDRDIPAVFERLAGAADAL